MNAHPLADVFPAMSQEEFTRLADSIERDGLLDPITLLDGAILDGRHRQRACDERGVEPRYEEWNPACGITPLEWVIARNLDRRQLTTGQKTALAVELEPRLAEAARERENARKKGLSSIDDSPPPKVYQRSSAHLAGKRFGVGAASVGRLKAVRDRDPVVFERVKTGELTVTKARSLIGLTPDHRALTSHTRTKLADALGPLRMYLKNWDESRLYGLTPKEARRLLRQVQEVDAVLFEVERALEARTVVSRALR